MRLWHDGQRIDPDGIASEGACSVGVGVLANVLNTSSNPSPICEKITGFLGTE